MRKNKRDFVNSAYTILTLDDDPIMTATLQSYFQIAGYHIDVENDPYQAIERVRNGSYDILLLDFLMNPICGDQVVEEIRKFDRDIFIILLTGHKSLAPPIKTIRDLEIQGYYEKSDRFDQLELLVESCVKSIKQLKTIKGYQESTAALLDAMPQVYSLENISNHGESILTKISELLDCPNGYLMLNMLEDGELVNRVFTNGEGLPGAEGLDLNDLIIKFSDKEKNDRLLYSPIVDEKNKPIGFLALLFDQAPTIYQVQLFQLFARQSSSALNNTQLMIKINKSYYDMIQVIRQMVDAKDIYTRGHSDRVSYYSHILSQALGKEEAFCERVRIAGLFHDIGKVGIPDEILMSDRKLTFDEFNIIKQHPVKSSNILSVVEYFKDIAPIVLSHHERIDGNGYPNGISGDSICQEARIVAIADAFDAMISTRRYRGAKSLDEAIEQLNIYKGTQFDAEFSEAFIDLLKNWEKIKPEIELCDIL